MKKGKSRGRRAWILGVVGSGGASEQRRRTAPQDAGAPTVREPDEMIGALRLERQVIDEAGAPVGDALVAISTKPPRTTRAQADDSFAFDQLIPRGFTVQARTATPVGSVRHQLTEESAPALVRVRRATRGETSVEIILGRGFTSSGKVRDEHKRPIAGATVSCFEMGGNFDFEVAQGEVQRDRDEKLPEGEHDATVSSPGASAIDPPRFTMWSPHQVATFTELRAGTYSLCALPFTGELSDAELVRRATRAHAKRPAFCKTLTVTEAPALQKVVIELPAMPPLPD